MDDAAKLGKLDRELGEVAAFLKHLPTQDTIRDVRKEMGEANFRTLAEVSQQISNMRTDLRDWVRSVVSESDLREEKARNESENRIMAAITAQNSKPWFVKNLPVLLALLGLAFAIISGNPSWLRMGGF